MFKYRIRMFFNELKLLVLMRRGRPEPEPGAPGSSGCGWPPFANCSARQDDEAEYYGGGGAETRPRSLALEEKDPRPQPPGQQPDQQPGAAGSGGALDSVSLSSSLDSGMRTPQCRICFQGLEQVSFEPEGQACTWKGLAKAAGVWVNAPGEEGWDRVGHTTCTRHPVARGW